jgi:hypothetical protein
MQVILDPWDEISTHIYLQPIVFDFLTFSPLFRFHTQYLHCFSRINTIAELQMT